MIDPALYISFLLISSLVIVVPGPNVLLILATALQHGRIRGLQTIFGTLIAMAFQLGIAAVGTAWLAELMSEAFAIVKWAGVGYLFYLGIERLRFACGPDATEAAPTPSARATFWRGFLVALTNPKTILFFGAFLPQFVTPSLPIAPQIALLSLSFLTLAFMFDVCYALFAALVGNFMKRPAVRRYLEGSVGLLFVGSGVGLALTKRA